MPAKKSHRKPEAAASPYQFYGRRQSRPLRKTRKAALEDHLAHFALLPDAALPGDLTGLFGVPVAEVALEIGFGGGEHLLWQAEHNPKVGFIGAEAFVNGMARVVQAASERGLENLRLYHGDARDLLDRLPPSGLSRIYLLFPDPWPKTRHHKRRLVQPDFLARLAALLRPGGILRVASDDPGYQTWILRHFRAQPDFIWLAGTSEDWLHRPDDWPQTRYEAKARAAGRRPIFLTYQRRV